MGAGGCLWSDYAHEGSADTWQALLGKANFTVRLDCKELPPDDPEGGYQPARGGL